MYARRPPDQLTPMRARELGHTVAMDFSYHTTPDNATLMVLHFIDEASKYHTAKIVREGKVQNYSDLGNCDASDLISAISEWARYMSNPSCFMSMKKAASTPSNSRSSVA